MEYTNLGKSGLKISRIVLGGMSYGSSAWQPWIHDEETALPLLKHAYELGINTWDTADVFSHGRSEEIIGKALRYYDIPRSSVVILSKIYFGVDLTGKQPGIGDVGRNDGAAFVNRVGLSRKHIFDAVEGCVKRLGTFVDVLQIHRLDRDTPPEEIMRALNDVVDSGMVRYIGASSMATWEFQNLQNIADRKGWHKFISMQNYHNLLYREEEREMIPYCEATGVGLIPWSPLARGILTRPWNSRDSKREATDKVLKTQIRERETDVNRAIVNRVEEVARRKGVSMAAVATAWSLGKGCCPILGLGSRQRIEEAVENIRVRLTEEDVKFLEDAYLPKPVTGY